MRARAWIAIAAVTVAAAGAWWWTKDGGTSEAAFDAWAAGLAARGIQASAGRVRAAGDGLALEDLAIAHAGEGWLWTADRVTATPAAGGRVTIAVAGTQTLTWRAGGVANTAEVGARSFRITSAPSEGGQGGSVLDAQAEGLVVRPPGGGDAIVARNARIQLVRAAGAGWVPDGSTVTAQVGDLVLPGFERSALGNRVDEIVVQVGLQRGLAGLDLDVEIPAWQASSTAIANVTAARVAWGLLNFRAVGTLGLDDAMRPRGTLNAQVSDVFPVVEALAAAGAVEARVAREFAAALFEGLASANREQLPFALRFNEGQIVLRDDDLDLPSIRLGTVGPLLGVVAE